jgi:hypothetical protein
VVSKIAAALLPLCVAVMDWYHCSSHLTNHTWLNVQRVCEAALPSLCEAEWGVSRIECASSSGIEFASKSGIECASSSGT